MHVGSAIVIGCLDGAGPVQQVWDSPVASCCGLPCCWAVTKDAPAVQQHSMRAPPGSRKRKRSWRRRQSHTCPSGWLWSLSPPRCLRWQGRSPGHWWRHDVRNDHPPRAATMASRRQIVRRRPRRPAPQSPREGPRWLVANEVFWGRQKRWGDPAPKPRVNTPKESDLPPLRCPILPLFRGCSPPSGTERGRPPKDTSLLVAEHDGGDQRAIKPRAPPREVSVSMSVATDPQRNPRGTRMEP
jgi:hypothetical protein